MVFCQAFLLCLLCWINLNPYIVLQGCHTYIIYSKYFTPSPPAHSVCLLLDQLFSLPPSVQPAPSPPSTSFSRRALLQPSVCDFFKDKQIFQVPCTVLLLSVLSSARVVSLLMAMHKQSSDAYEVCVSIRIRRTNTPFWGWWTGDSAQVKRINHPDYTY